MLFQRRSGRKPLVTWGAGLARMLPLGDHRQSRNPERLTHSPDPSPWLLGQDKKSGWRVEGASQLAKVAVPGLTQLLEDGVALQGQGQLLRALVADLVVAEVQLPQGDVACQGPAESGEGIFPRAQVVPLQDEAMGRVDVQGSRSICSHGVQGGLRRAQVSDRKSGAT